VGKVARGQLKEIRGLGGARREGGGGKKGKEKGESPPAK